MKVNVIAVIIGLIFILAIGCAAPEQSVQAPQAAPHQAAPAEKPAAPVTPPPAAPAEMPTTEKKVEAPTKEEKSAAVATNVIKLVQQDGYVVFDKNDIKVKKGSIVTFQYAGEKSKTVVNVYGPDGKPVGKLSGSGYLVSGQEWATPSLDKEGVYSMKILYGKKLEGTITVE